MNQDRIEALLASGDISKMSQDERLAYYKALCEATGLNPLLAPFEYMVLKGKTTLYAKKSATESLRARHGISLTIVSREIVNGVYVVTARATMPDGRQDESIGSVFIDAAKGDDLANALMKAETKSKRRVTLSICGLGLLDETELATIPGTRTEPVQFANTTTAPALPESRNPALDLIANAASETDLMALASELARHAPKGSPHRKEVIDAFNEKRASFVASEPSPENDGR